MQARSLSASVLQPPKVSALGRENLSQEVRQLLVICSSRPIMEDRKQENPNNAWMSVPAFGDWEMRNGVPDYSVDFSKIREMRKQNKNDLSRASLGNEDELVAAHKAGDAGGGDDRREDYARLPRSPTGNPASGHSPTGRKKFASYFVCCTGA